MEEIIHNLPEWINNPISIKWAEALLGLFFFWFIFSLIRNILANRIDNAETRYRTRKIVSFIGYFFIIVYVASLFSENISKLTLILGGIGAGIAFALQEVIASFAGWVAVSFGQFYKPGDRVQLGGIMGDVIDVSILRTTLMECGGWVKSDLYNGRIVRIANSFVFKEPVFNYSADFSFVWDEIVIPLKHGSDRALAKEIILKAAYDIVGNAVPNAQSQWASMIRKYLIEHASVEPRVTLIATDNWLEYTLRYVVNYKERRLQKDLLFNRILDDIDKSCGKLVIASTTLHVVDMPVIDIRSQSKESILDKS